MPQITLNGESRQLPTLGNLSELLAYLQIPPKNVLVEQNGTAVDRVDFGRTSIAEGDQIELVQMVAGG